ncbi:hypothetical protein SAMN05192571_10255 [Pleomorphomonas diazotrophica]|uniref:UPF0104 family protein n=1 Tax=Pleomorphomonas diazotrophica TaxID=1166257 RepID=UPI0008DF865A|nr:UPF0104 family protein [Pleomorphomonas diazotrophica]SFM52590.1 hypothetical protein SAMN05192571_10255 [Pleomorphomonas diazotrophica]
MSSPSDDDSSVETPPGRFARALRWVGPVIAVVLIAGAVWVLWDMATKMSLADIRTAVVTLPVHRFVLAFVFTFCGIGALATYDLLALHALNYTSSVSLTRAVFGGLIANVFANTLGFPLLSGGGARYRIYSMVGVSFSVVARLIVMSWLTMWSGILFVLGLALTLEPTTQFPVFPHHYIDRLVGLVILVALTGFIVWLAKKRRAIRVSGMVVRMPKAKPAFLMVLAGAFDLLAACGTLYVLLPPDTVPDAARYLVTYSIAFLAGMAANTPGGVGVFEATVVTGLGIPHRPDVAAALILFRLIYFVVPLLFALALLAFLEGRHRLAVRRARREDV